MSRAIKNLSLGFALWAIIFATVGVHLVHPFHHSCIEEWIGRYQGSLVQRACCPIATKGGASLSQRECGICRFLAGFHTPALISLHATLFFGLVLHVSPILGPALSQSRSDRAHQTRAPPSPSDHPASL